MSDMEMSFSLKCSVCGNDQFSAIDESIDDLMDAPDYIEIKCSDCCRAITKEQLIEENSYLIDANIEGFKKDVVKQFKKDIKKIFK